MSTEKPTKKTERLFSTHPPTSPPEIRELFYNRENELFHGQDLLKNGSDFERILAVHGETQVGKSHLVQRILLDVQLWGTHYLIFQVNANTRGSVEAVLEELLVSLRNALEKFEEEQDVPDGAQLVYDNALRYFRRLEPLLSRESNENTLSKTKEEVETFTLDAKLTLLPAKWLNFAVGGANQSQQKLVESSLDKLTRLTASDLVVHIRYAADVLRELQPHKKILLFVDDLDLLDRSGAAGKEESHKLTDYLKHLASTPAIVIIATIRHAYFNGRQKELDDFIEVGLLKPHELCDVYRRRIALYNAGEDIFDQESLHWLAKGAEGKVGIFLSRVHKIWRANRRKQGLIGLPEVKKFVDEHIGHLLNIPGNVAVISKIIEAAKSQQSQVDLAQDLSDSELLHRVLHPESTPNQYTIDPLYVEVLQEMNQGTP